ncbi:hypothetical protein PHLCEN_2v12463 [Hermanssonia centrifuga]|uniref:O-methyltransferase C-terminal domain-containing protein n=1 Tax=Hermanssonia centrifuga TaxID=98765 RepID=A0A2R6NGV1_9APHY|nr:hypothetical protein PHLCEN_2v12463 [Hermanssonia centrifuga]
MDTQFQELDSLQRTLNHAIDTFRKELIAANLPALSSQATEPHPLDDNNYLAPTRLYEARRLAIASIVQLKNLLQYPFEKASEDAYAVYDRACVDVMISTGLADCLGKAPDRKKGLHVDDLQKELDMDGRKLTIVLRYLCTQGWVRETQEGVFALNRIGNELLEGSLGRGRLGSPYVPELAGTLVKWLQHPEWKYSDSVLHTPVQIVHKTDLSCFDWVKTRPDLFPYLSEAMRAAGNAYIRGLLTDYPWGSLEGQTIVDCGGGTGAMSIALAKTFPSLRFIIQDLPETLTLAKAQVGKLAPQAAAEGRIMTEFQDFFQPQCRKGDDYHYLFRHVL